MSLMGKGTIVIDGCGGLYMAFMAVEVRIWHLWLWRSVYGIYGC